MREMGVCVWRRFGMRREQGDRQTDRDIDRVQHRQCPDRKEIKEREGRDRGQEHQIQIEHDFLEENGCPLHEATSSGFAHCANDFGDLTK